MNKNAYTEYELKMSVSPENFESSYRKKLLILLVCLLANYYLVFVGLPNFPNEPDAIWFQRAGALIVLFSVIAEYFYVKIQRMVNETLINYGEGEFMTRMQSFNEKNLPKEYSNPEFNILFSPQILLFAVYGTLVWGYGDLIYEYF